MPKAWKEDQIYLIKAIPAYRTVIGGKDDKTAKKMTIEFAETLHHRTPELQHRSVAAITQRLPYLDNLLAGVWEVHNYAEKDWNLYFTKPRTSLSREPNLCNTRHSYNGALRV